MAVKSVIDIEVNSEAFKQFNNVFNGYKKALEKTPKQWQQATKELKEQKDIVYVVNQNFGKIANTQSKINANASRFNRELEHSKRASASVATNMSNIYKSAIGTTFNVLKWGAVTAFGLGTGALFGISALAGNASRERNTNLSLGVNPARARGLRDAFKIYGIGADALLSGVLGAQIDPSKQVGFNGVAYQGLRPDQVLPDLLTNYRNLYKTDKYTALQQGSHVGLDAGTLELLSNLNDSEFKAMIENIKKIASERYITDDQLKKAQDLYEVFGRLTKHIQDNFLALLLKFEPVFKQWTLDLTKWIDDVFKSGKVEKFLNDLAREVQELYKNLKELNVEYKKFAEDISRIWGYFTGENTAKKFRADPDKEKYKFIPPKDNKDFWSGSGIDIDAYMRRQLDKWKRREQPSSKTAPNEKPQSNNEVGTEYRQSNDKESSKETVNRMFFGDRASKEQYFGKVPTYGNLNNEFVKYFVTHHAGGHSLEGAMATAGSTGYGTHFYITRDGEIVQGASLQKTTAHILDSNTVAGLNNRTSIGVEVLAKNNADVTEAQKKAVVRLAEELARYFPLQAIVPHGYANKGHKQPNEGMAGIDYIRENQIVITNASGSNLTIITGGVQ